MVDDELIATAPLSADVGSRPGPSAPARGTSSSGCHRAVTSGWPSLPLPSHRRSVRHRPGSGRRSSAASSAWTSPVSVRLPVSLRPHDRAAHPRPSHRLESGRCCVRRRTRVTLTRPALGRSCRARSLRIVLVHSPGASEPDTAGGRVGRWRSADDDAVDLGDRLRIVGRTSAFQPQSAIRPNSSTWSRVIGPPL